MRDLTEEFCKKYPVAVRAFAARLLQIDSNMRACHGVALAGGALRDTYFETKIPKDLDFAFYGMGVSDLLEVVRQYRARVPGAVTFEDITAQGDEYEEEIGAQRIKAVIRVTEGDLVMDWILYNADTLQEVTAMFDYNLNRFAMYYDEYFTLHVEWQAEDWGACTRNWDAHVNDDRANRFRDLAESIGWAPADDAVQRQSAELRQAIEDL